MIPNEANILMEIKTNVRPQNGKNILFKASGRLLRRIINRLLWSLASA